MKKAFVISAALLCCAGVASAVAFTHTSSPDKLESSLVAYGTQQDPETDEEGNVIDNTPTEAVPVNLVSVVDPFSGNMNTPMTFVTLDPNSVDTIAGVTDNQMTDRELVLPSDFSKIGAAVSTTPNTKDVIIMQRLHFNAPCAIRWDSQTDATGQYSWDEHPASLEVTSGQTVIVTYRSEDYGRTWKGSVVSS